MYKIYIVWRARWGRSRRRCLATHTHATIADATVEGTSVFFVDRSGTDGMQQWRNLRWCFLWGPTAGYIR
jgi:hypothetical protein